MWDEYSVQFRQFRQHLFEKKVQEKRELVLCHQKWSTPIPRHEHVKERRTCYGQCEQDIRRMSSNAADDIFLCMSVWAVC